MDLKVALAAELAEHESYTINWDDGRVITCDGCQAEIAPRDPNNDNKDAYRAVRDHQAAVILPFILDVLAAEAREAARLGAASGRTIDDLPPSLIDGAGYWLRAKAKRLRRG